MKSSYLFNILTFTTSSCIVAPALAQCSASSLCPVGCCSQWGSCGTGPDYCAKDTCISTCDYKAECLPPGANWNPVYANATDCPLNVCCSKYGFCGTTSDFCSAKDTVKEPSCSGTSSNGRTIGYYEGWSTTRPCEGLKPSDLPDGVYSHLNYAFAVIDPDTFEISLSMPDESAIVSNFTALKDQFENLLEVWISIGGWSFNDPGPTANTFSTIAGSSSAQAAFSASLIAFQNQYGFDGVDIDWEYPVAPERGGSPDDFKNYVTWLTSLKSDPNSNGHTSGLSITLPASYWYLQNFDIVHLVDIVDWFNVMTYDLHGTWDATDMWIGAVTGAHTNLTEISSDLDLLWRNNIDPSKVNMGLGFYGRSYTLADPSCTQSGCPFSGGGNPGPCTATSGILSGAEIENIIGNLSVSVTTDTTAAVNIAVWGNQWVSYDDEKTLKMKTDWASSHCLGGTMVWAADLDTAYGDFAGALGDITGRTLLCAVNEDL